MVRKVTFLGAEMHLRFSDQIVVGGTYYSQYEFSLNFNGRDYILMLEKHDQVNADQGNELRFFWGKSKDNDESDHLISAVEKKLLKSGWYTNSGGKHYTDWVYDLFEKLTEKAKKIIPKYCLGRVNE